MLLASFGMELRVYCIHVLHFYSMYKLSSYNVTFMLLHLFRSK